MNGIHIDALAKFGMRLRFGIGFQESNIPDFPLSSQKNNPINATVIGKLIGIPKRVFV